MTTNSVPPPSQGLVAGKYELVRLIGRGGMGSVWEARHVSLGTSSAIKFIEAEYANSPEARSRFDKEAKAAATIQSKHAIQIYDHGVTDDGKPYIVMELLQGEPLDKRIDRGPLSLAETARVLQQVCRALSRAHERGIIHRDLKPENIFLVQTPDDEEPIAKVLDFGIAKMQSGGPTSGVTSSTKTGAVLGTPFYMSPEQARGLRNVDHRADVWSLGVIAFKCVTGKLPFDGESVGDLLVKICTAPIPIPSQVAASLGIGGIPPAFDAWFLRALEREPERRFPSVAQLSDELCAAAGLPSRGAPPSHYTPSNLGTRPMHSGPSGYGTPAAVPYGTPPATAALPMTPPPGAMTNAPFTREEIAGVPSGKGKLVVGGIIAGLAAVGGVVGILLHLRNSAITRAEPTNTAGIVAPATSNEPAPSAEPSTSAEAPPAPPPAPAAPGASAEPVAKNDASNVTPPPSPPPKTPKTPSTPSKTPARADTAKSISTTAPPLPPPQPTPSTPSTTKRPNKLDPGY